MSYNPAMQMGNHHMFDNVFVNPEAYKAFVETGTWPDARSPTRAREPRTEITRPKDVTVLDLMNWSLTPIMGSCD